MKSILINKQNCINLLEGYDTCIINTELHLHWLALNQVKALIHIVDMKHVCLLHEVHRGNSNRKKIY